MLNYEFLQVFCSSIIKLDRSIRWAGIANRSGVLLSVEMRQGLKPLLTEEENEEYAANAIARHKTRVKFEPKIGKLLYAFGRYEKLSRATITVNENYYLLITIDVEEKNFDSIILDKVIPLMESKKSGFADPDAQIAERSREY